MQLSNAPTQLQLAFASSDSSKTSPFPVPSQIGITGGRASFTDGFVPLNATPVSSGGIPPFKSDMNGLLYDLSGVDVWMSAGALFPWSSGYSTAIGGYPKGARVLRATGNGIWINTVDNNASDPDTNGAGWIPDRAVSSVYASGQQALTPSGGNTKVNWDTVEFDSLGQWDGSNHRFKALWPGQYKFSGALFLPSAVAQNYALQAYKTGAFSKLLLEFPQVSSVDLTMAFSVILSLAVNDYVELFIALAAATYGGQSGSNESYVYGQFEYLGNG